MPAPVARVSIRRRVLTASLWVTMGLLAGRVAGIVREFLIADTFGVSRNADVAILLVTGPELLVTIAGSGAVGLVLIPLLLEHDIASQLRLIRRLTLQLGAVAVALAIVAAALVIAFGTSWATGPQLDSQTFRSAVLIAALAVPPSMVVVLSAAFLRAQDRFAVVSLSTVTFTIPILITIVTFRSVIGVALGIAIGAALRYGMQAVLIRQRWERPGPAPVRMAVTRSDVAAAFGISVMLAAQVSVPLVLVAVLGEAGDVALLNYGWRILLIPISLLGSIFSVAAYPSIVRILHDESAPSRPDLTPVVRPVILLSIVVGVWLWVNAEGAIGAVYRPAGLTEDALRDVTDGLRGGALAVPLITIGTAATTVLFGLKQSRLGLIPYALATPLLITLGGVLSVTNGPTGTMYAISGYAILLCVSAGVILYRSFDLAVVRRVDTPALLLAVAGASALAFAIRALLPTANLISIAVNGATFVLVCLGANVMAGRRTGGVEPVA